MSDLLNRNIHEFKDIFFFIAYSKLSLLHLEYDSVAKRDSVTHSYIHLHTLSSCIANRVLVHLRSLLKFPEGNITVKNYDLFKLHRGSMVA